MHFMVECDTCFRDQRQQLYSNVHRTVQDVSVRILNWSILIRNIRGFYLVFFTTFYLCFVIDN